MALDYYGDYSNSKELVAKLLEYYHKRGYKHIKVWLEPDLTSSGDKFWAVRSNITFDVDTISKKLLH